MEVPVVLKYVGKKVRLVLKNNYNYTCTIPKHKDWSGEKSFSIKDKFGENVDIECEFIAIINEINDEHWRNIK
jgi:hypothetical protein